MKNSSFLSWFKGIKGRLLLAACLPVIGFVIISGVSLRGLTKINTLLDTAQESIIPNLSALGKMRYTRNTFSSKTFEAILYSSDPDKRSKLLASARENIKGFTENYDKYKKASFLPSEEAIHARVQDKIPELITAMNTIANLMDANDPEKTKQAGELLEGTFSQIGREIGNFNQDVTALYEKTASDQNIEAKATQTEVFNMLILITAISAILIFAALLWIAVQISKSVGSIADRLNGASNQVATAVEQLNEAGNSLSQSSTESAASLEETVAALEEMSSMVQMNSDNAKQAAALSASSRDAAETGESEIKTLISSMTEISRSSKKIEEIISVIDDIAFQTNLLALNAAVEAARAGEQGKGFAVVAEAVRTLAQRSAASAKDINSLIKESVSQIEKGSHIADQSGTVLSNIVNSIKKVSDLNNEIAAASSEQTTGIQQITKAMNQLDQSAQSNAASAEEIAATSGEISNLAMNPLNLTVDLHKVVLGTNSQPSPSVESTSVSRKSPSPTLKKTTNVIPLKKPVTPVPLSKAKSAAAAIPFDEDERAQVGTTDGF